MKIQLGQLPFFKWVDVLLVLDDLSLYRPSHCYVERLYRHVDIGRSNLQLWVKRLIKAGLIESTRKLDRNMLGLTDEGKHYVKQLGSIYRVRPVEVRK